MTLPGCGLFGGGTLLGGELGIGFVLDSNPEVDVLSGKSTHIVDKAKWTVVDDIGRENRTFLGPS